MANFELTIKYVAKDVQFWRSTLLLSSPIWGGAIPVVCLFVCSFILYKTDYNPGMIIGIVTALLFFSLACLCTTLTLMDTRIILSKNGLRFPPFMTLFSAHANGVKWSKIKALSVLSILDEPEADISKLPLEEMLLQFKMLDGDEISLVALNIVKTDLEKLLLALNAWLPEDVRNPNLVYLEKQLRASFPATAFAPIEPGFVFPGRYLEVIRQLSFGRLSAVYLCQEKGMYERILKQFVIPPNTRPELKAKARQMFEKEVAVLLKLEHPQIVKVVQFFNESERSYILLEYSEGKTLREIIGEDGPQPEERVIRIAKSLCLPLAYLHGQDPTIVHKDISPENIILQEDTAIIIDFGAANEFLGTVTSTMVGKQAYVAPEQFAGRAATASDLYSVGATLYFLLTGVDPIPLTCSSPKKYLADNSEISDIKISEQMDQLVKDLTEIERSDRLDSIQTLIMRLDALA